MTDYANTDLISAISSAIKARFGEEVQVDENLSGLDELARISSRRVHRNYLEKEVEPELLRLLCACALSSPSKSDLQQADILIVKDQEKRRILSDLLPSQVWLKTAPVVLIFLANGRRLGEIAKFRGKPFANNHLDLFFNASVDTGIVMTTFMRAADAIGLGTCPISVVRDHSEYLSELFQLPERVIPVAGMCVGWPEKEGTITPRLSLKCTIHEDHYDEGNLKERIEDFDRRRAKTHPLKQRDPERWGEAPFYGWSEDKARQFGIPQCTEFGQFVRKKGFRLD